MRGNLRWRNGAWRIQVWDAQTGRHRHATVHSPNTRAGRKIAEAEVARLILRVETGRAADPTAITFADALDRWVDLHAADWSPKTLLEHQAKIRLYLRPELGNRRLRDLRGADLDALYARLRKHGANVKKKPLGPGSVRKIHNIAHAALAQAVRWGWIDTNPADAATSPKVPATRIQPPDPAQIAKILDRADPDLAMFLRLAATTGARRGQLCALRWSDIDLDGGEITFTRALTTGPDGIIEKGTKTDRPYTVAVGAPTITALKAHRARQAERHLGLGATVTKRTHVFTRPTTPTQPWRPDRASHLFAKLCEDLKLDGIQLKNLRHAMATQMLAAGVDVRTVAGRLGHANPYVTLRTYAAFLPAADRDAADQIEQILGG